MDRWREANKFPVGMVRLMTKLSPESVTVGHVLSIIPMGLALTLNVEGLRGMADNPWEVTSEPPLAPTAPL